MRRAALIVDLAKLKGVASVEAFGARFFFKDEQTQPQAQQHAHAAVVNPPSARDSLADLMAHPPPQNIEYISSILRGAINTQYIVNT